jgi:hypothetical protein
MAFGDAQLTGDRASGLLRGGGSSGNDLALGHRPRVLAKPRVASSRARIRPDPSPHFSQGVGASGL